MRTLLITLLLIVSALYGYSQELTVQGKVTGAEDELPIPGVSVTVKGSSMGTATDLEGNYTIAVPDANAVLIFSFLGMSTVEETVGGRTEINIAMSAAADQLDEVVVIGYGTAAKRDLTGS